jgi:hypothetical protein
MDYSTLVALVSTTLSAVTVSGFLLLSFRRRYEERRGQVVLEEIRLRETQLKYEFAISTESRRRAVELVQETLRALDDLESDPGVARSPSLRARLRDLRDLQYDQLRALLQSFDEDRGEQDLTQLRGLLTRSRTDLRNLPASDEEVATRD